MITRTETPQLHLLPILNLLGIAIAPLDGHVRVSVRVNQDVESAVAVELRKECHGGGDLPEYRLDFGLDFFFGFFGRWLGGFSVLLLMALLLVVERRERENG